MTSDDRCEYRVLLLPPSAKDARITRDFLARAGIECAVCGGLDQLRREIAAGAGAILLTDEMLKAEGAAAGLAETLRQQPAWSDLPIVLLASGGAGSPLAAAALEKLGNALVLDRPVRLPTLLSAVKTALRSRERQYEIRGNIAALKQAKKDLEAAKEGAEAANQAKSQFLASMSHELRTPMSAILGMTELALGEELSPQIRDYLQTVRDAGDSLLSLLNDILDFSRIEAGRLDLESSPFPLRRTLADTCKVLSVRANQKGIHLTCEVADPVPDGLVGDPHRLRQILTNLVGNAIKFTERGRIAVHVNVESQSDEALCLHFDVEDTGIGIEREVQEQIFAPFAQADASMSRRFGGTGLGLAITANLVRMMGGRIWVESQPGRGSTFSFTACFAPAKQPLPPPEPSQAVAVTLAPRALRVLLAEDTPANQKLVVRILQKRGHVVEVADNGVRAVEMVRRQPFDVVLMDVQMPMMDGFQATQAIRDFHNVERPAPPIIAMTAHALRGDQERCLAAGMDAYVSKPIDAAKLVELVEQLGQGQPQA